MLRLSCSYVIAILCLASGLHPRGGAAAVILDVGISVDQTTYNLSDTINWTLTAGTQANAGESVLGIAGLSIYLDESTAETLSPGTIDAGWSVADYAIRDGGSVNAGDASILEGIEVANFGLTGSAVGTPAEGTITLATGSYTASVLGSHTLTTSTPFPADQGYFAGSFFSVSPFDILTNDSVMFEVVPETTAGLSLLPLLFATLALRIGTRMPKPVYGLARIAPSVSE